MPPSSITPYALYVAGAIGAVGLYLLIRPGPAHTRIAGTLIGLAGVALLMSEALRGVANVAGENLPVIPAILGLVAVAGATRMVTHPKPVFAALYFVLVVVSSAGLFLVLQAEFMAFALIIVYAGAILITYMFVLMLAQQSPSDAPAGGGDIEAGSLYDRIPREPLAAIAVGFVLLATLGDVLFSNNSELRQPVQRRVLAEANARRWNELALMPRRLNEVVQQLQPGAVATADDQGRLIRVAQDGTATVRVRTDAGATSFTDLPLPPDALPTNTQSVGLSLVSRFPASLELASVILLMAMFGAVVLARKQIELGEDERREAAGMRRLSIEEADFPGGATSPGEELASIGASTGSRGGRS
ncbi:MAG: NADH-quinone oxidoreductase subunit J [Phycisphaerales bacterium]